MRKMMYAMSRCSTPLVTKPARAAYSNASLSVARSTTPCRDLSVMTSCTRFLTVAKHRAVDELAVGDGSALFARRPQVVGIASHGVSMTPWTTSWTRAEIGALGERLAVEHLQSLGLRVLTCNWRCRYGELDVIAADDVLAHRGVRRGEDPHQRPVRRRRAGRHAGQGAPTAAAGRVCGWPLRTVVGRRCASTSSACASGGGVIRRSPICRGLADGARAGVLGGRSRSRRAHRGDRGRHHVGAARRASGRVARRRATGVARPGPRGDHQLRQQLADGAADVGALTRHAAEDGLRLRHRPGAGGAVRAPQGGVGAAREDRSAGRTGARRTGAAGQGGAAGGHRCEARGLAGRGRAGRQPRRSQPGGRHRRVGCADAGPVAVVDRGEGATRGQDRQAVFGVLRPRPTSPT